MFTSDSSGAPDSPEPSATWQDYTELKEMLKALGDNARLNIVHALSAGGEVKVTDLALRLVVSQPLVSWHLAILRRHGLVRTRRSGREVYCSLDLERFRRCERLLASVVAEPGGASAPSGQSAPGPPRRDASRGKAITPAVEATSLAGHPGGHPTEPTTQPEREPARERTDGQTRLG
jgi:ArsR family transcriptional regulator